MNMEEKRGFVFNTPEGDVNMEIEDVMRMANDGDPDGLYALGMAYLFGWDICHVLYRRQTMLGCEQHRHRQK